MKGAAPDVEEVGMSIIIPAYNEEDRLPAYLRQVLVYFKCRQSSFEIIVVDDGSRDATAAVVVAFMAQSPEVKLIRVPVNRGKGHAVKVGMLRASGKLLLFADADGATPISEVERLEKAMQGGVDVAVASRALHDDSCSVTGTLHRKMLGTLFNLIVRMITVRGIMDTQCGFKLFTKEAALAAFPFQRIEGFGFDVEILYTCHMKGFRISEVPVTWTDIPKSRVRLIRDSWRMFNDVLMVRLNHIRGYYNDQLYTQASPVSPMFHARTEQEKNRGVAI